MFNSDLMLFGIGILNCEEIHVSEEGSQYVGITFLINSLSKYDGKVVEVLHDWTFKVFDNEGQILDSFYLIENDEFKKKLYELYPLK